MLTGTWIAQGAEFGGQAWPLPPTRWLIAGETYVIEAAEGRDEGRLVVDTSVTPHRVDLVGTSGPNQGRTIPALFRTRGNLLQLCYAVGDTAAIQPRPTEMRSAPGLLQVLVRYRREG